MIDIYMPFFIKILSVILLERFYSKKIWRDMIGHICFSIANYLHLVYCSRMKLILLKLLGTNRVVTCSLFASTTAMRGKYPSTHQIDYLNLTRNSRLRILDYR